MLKDIDVLIHELTHHIKQNGYDTEYRNAMQIKTYSSHPVPASVHEALLLLRSHVIGIGCKENAAER